MTAMDSKGLKAVFVRAFDLILHPQRTWAAIAAEPTTLRSLFTGYVMVLAAVPPVAGLIGGALFGFGASIHGGHKSILGLLASGTVEYGLTLGGVFVMGLIIERAAPYFRGARDQAEAMKLAAYFPTAAWCAGMFRLVPALEPFEVVGLYGLVLLWLGLPRLVPTPKDETLAYTVSMIAAALVVTILVRSLAGAVETSLL